MFSIASSSLIHDLLHWVPSGSTDSFISLCNCMLLHVANIMIIPGWHCTTLLIFWFFYIERERERCVCTFMRRSCIFFSFVLLNVFKKKYLVNSRSTHATERERERDTYNLYGYCIILINAIERVPYALRIIYGYCCWVNSVSSEFTDIYLGRVHVCFSLYVNCVRCAHTRSVQHAFVGCRRRRCCCWSHQDYIL